MSGLPVRLHTPTRERFELMLNALGYRTGMFAINRESGEYVVPVVQQAWELWQQNNDSVLKEDVHV